MSGQRPGQVHGVEQALSACLDLLDQACDQQETLVLAYSGGVDSTCLLHALKQHGVFFHALHVNHQLQPASDQWAEHCAQVCAKLDVPFEVLRIDVSQCDGLGLEGQARQARYRALFDWMKVRGHRFLVCAHHLDDQLETILIQLLRGSGLRGVGGMRVLAPAGVDGHLYPEIQLLRPLLRCSKQTLLTYANTHRLQCVEDPSNIDTTFRRNWIRHELLPSMRSQYPQTPQALLRLAEHFQTYYDGQDQLYGQLASQLLNADGQLLLAPWRALASTEQTLSLHQWLREQGVRCGQAKLQELARQLQKGPGGLRTVAKGWGVRVRRDVASVEFSHS